MRPRTLLVLALVFAAGTALAKLSHCESDCEVAYKVCATSGKSSERNCFAAREKCRKACVKKANTGPAE